MKRRIGHISKTTLALTLAISAAAFGYFLLTTLGEGEGASKLGTGSTVTYPVKVSFAEGLVPGKTEPVTVMLENTTGKATDVKAVKIVITDSAPECKASWFSVSSSNKEWNEILTGTKAAAAAPVAVPIGNTTFTTMVANITLEFKEEASVNQEACEGSTLTLKAVAAA
jgi:hypothetical protein